MPSKPQQENLSPQKPHAFAALTPDAVIEAVESCGYFSDGRNYPLNSYENRVYQVGIEDNTPLVAKFYRQERWSPAQIQEEHDWTLALSTKEIDVCAPCVLPYKSSAAAPSPSSQQPVDNATLFSHEGFSYALFPKIRGEAPEPDNLDQLYAIGQLIGQIHSQSHDLFSHRLTLSPEHWGEASQHYLLTSPYLPSKYIARYTQATNKLLNTVQEQWELASFTPIKLHGDCHRSNILWNQNKPTLLDFDDAINGPALQDLWMLLSGDRKNQNLQLSTLLEGYEEYYEFNRQELPLLESLRTLRIISYSAWLARRQGDPAFKRAFSWFGSEEYWQQHIKDLEQQISALQSSPLLSEATNVGNC